MEYILILLFMSTGFNPTINVLATIEFNTQQACLVAANHYNGKGKSKVIAAHCWAKGKN